MTSGTAPRNSRRRLGSLVSAMVVLVAVTAASDRPVAADPPYQRISGEGSSWAANFIDSMRVNVRQFGMTVDYNPSGSTSGRKNFLNGTVDFAASDIPFQFQPEDGSAPENPAPGSYAYIPVVAGGTALMYNLKINGQRVTNLRLSGENVAKIFTKTITQWNDPAIAADNPGLTLPGRPIVPVVRSDGSGATAQFTLWMIAKHPAIWNAYCQASGRAPACGYTSFYPTVQGMIAQSGDLGVAGYVSQGFAEGAIGYVNYSYALGAQFPVAKVLNAAGYYTEPTPQNVAVSLLRAQINRDESNPAVYLTQDLTGVYSDSDPRNYQLSSYSYFILPTKVGGQFNEAKGNTLGDFAYYMMCQGQQQSASLGYSPMPVNLVQASIEQIAKIPGVNVQSVDIRSCNNPTFSPDGTNLLAKNAPAPKACDRQGPTQCPDGTGGMGNVKTPVNTPTSPSTTVPPTTVATGGGPATTVPAGAGGPPTTMPGGTTPGGGTIPVPTTPDGGTIPAPTTPDGGTLPPETFPGETVAPGVDDGSSVGGGGLDGNVAADPAGLVCDADTMICLDAGVAGQASGLPVGQVTTATLGRRAGGLPLTMLVVVLLLGVIFAPAYAWRAFARRRVA